MTFDSIKASLALGLTVCYKTSRYEVLELDNGLVAANVYDSSSQDLTPDMAKQCFIKTGGV